MTISAKVLLGGGNGLVAIRAYALLFLPGVELEAEMQPLVDAFLEAPGADEAVEGLKQFVVRSDFTVPAFVAALWVERAELTVFGDIDIETTSPSAPLLTGRGLPTWVEHTVRTEDALTIRSSGAIVVPFSGIEEGIVPAGCFELSLAYTTQTTRHQPKLEPQVEVRSSDIGARLDPIVAASSELERSNEVFHEPVVATTEPSGPGEKDGLAIAEQPAPTRIDPPYAAMPDARVEALVCPNGHANRPTLSQCTKCNQPLKRREIVERPALGSLLLEDGSTIEICEGLILGRRPEPKDGRRSINIEGDLVSRTHAELIVEAWDVYVQDLGSRNGTYVVPSPGSEPTRLSDGAKLLVLPGAIIQLGATRMDFVAVQHEDEAIADLLQPSVHDSPNELPPGD